MSDFIVVRERNGNEITVYTEVAERHGVKDGDVLGHQKFDEVLGANLHHGLAICRLNIAIELLFDCVEG